MDTTRPPLRRWIFGTLLILFSWIIVGSLLTGLIAHRWGLSLAALSGTDDKSLAIVRSYEPWQAATAILVSFLPLLVAVPLVHRFILGRSLAILFTRHRRFFTSEIRIGFLTMSAILIVSGLPDFIVNNADYTFAFEARRFLPYLLIAFTLIPCQTTAEELFFRGWIQQRLDNGRRGPWRVSLIGGTLFALPHLSNPEVNGELAFAAVGYGATGFMFAWVAYRDHSLGTVIGAHAANNILAGILVSSADSALPGVSLWTTPTVDWGSATIFSVTIIPIFIWLTGKWRDKVAR